MNKLVIVTVFIAVLALGGESFRLPREVEEEEKGPVTNMLDKLRGYYNYSVDVVKDLKLDEKAKNLYGETRDAVRTYAGILHDQIYHMIYSSDSV